MANPACAIACCCSSESGAAYTFCENAHAYRLTPWHNDAVSDPSGEALYVRDEETGRFWSPSPQPSRGAGTYVSETPLRLEQRERTRIIEQRIDALLAEAHQLSISVDDVIDLIRRRQAAMARHPSTAAAAGKERRR